MALRQYRPDLYEEIPPKETEVSYHSYRGRHAHINRLKELLFFAHIAIFSILTVFATYIYLSLSIPAILAFALGMGTSLSSLHLVRSLIKRYATRHRQKTKRP